MTNFWLVNATVTTSTMEALPIITPMEVSTARTLLARKASTATATASRMCICVPKISRSVLSELLQRFLGRLVLGVQFQGRLIFAARAGRILLDLQQPPQPVMGNPGARIFGVFRGHFQILTQQLLRFRRLFILQNQPDAAEKLSTRIALRQFLPGAGHGQQLFPVLTLQIIIADIVDALGAFRLEFQSFRELRVRSIV